MKRFIQLSLASLVMLLGLGFTPLAAPADAIKVFQGCGSGGSSGTGDAATGDGTDAGTGTTGDGAATDGTAGGATDGADDGGIGTAAGSTDSGGAGSSDICGASTTDKLPDIIKNVINAILFALGIAAVVMIVLGGIKYTTSNGDSGNITSAKNTILYAVVGLVVAIMAYAIVNFVLDRLG